MIHTLEQGLATSGSRPTCVPIGIFGDPGAMWKEQKGGPEVIYSSMLLGSQLCDCFFVGPCTHRLLLGGSQIKRNQDWWSLTQNLLPALELEHATIYL